MAKGDSATSHHYWQDQDNTVLMYIQNSPGPSILLPNGELISSTKKGLLPLSKKLSTNVSTAIILPGLKSASLISIGQLCDDNCDMYLNNKIILAVKNNEVIMDGKRNLTDSLWDIPIQNTTLSKFNHPLPPIHPGIYKSSPRIPTANIIKYKTSPPTKNRVAKLFRQFRQLIYDNIDYNIIEKQQQTDAQLYLPVKIALDNSSMLVIIHKKKTHMELAQYLHVLCLSPVKSTMITAVKQHHFKSWPGLTPQIISKNLPTPIATVQGHLYQERQNF